MLSVQHEGLLDQGLLLFVAPNPLKTFVLLRSYNPIEKRQLQYSEYRSCEGESHKIESLLKIQSFPCFPAWPSRNGISNPDIASHFPLEAVSNDSHEV